MERRTFLGALAASSAAAGLPDVAFAARERAPAKPTTITLLGTGTPTPSLERQGSGYLIEVGDDLIVMDHGLEQPVMRGRRFLRLLHASALRSLHGLRTPGAATLGSGRGQDL